MKLSECIPAYVRKVMDQLLANNYQVNIVGGGVRDLLMGQIPRDFDLLTSAEIPQLANMFPRIIPLGEKYGTIIVVEEGRKVEISSCRNTGREDVDWATRLYENLRCRDFTINAMAMDRAGILFDPFNGSHDIKRRIIRSPEDAGPERFRDDPLRMLRAVRFAVVLDFELDNALYNIIGQCHSMLAQVAVERIREELNAILLSSRPGWGMRMLVDTGLMQFVVPEILPTVGFEQHNRAHIFDVFNHSLVVLDKVPPTLELRLAALLHDSGKPATFTQDERGVGHFYQHQQESRQLCKDALTRLKYSNAVIEKVSLLVGEHMIWLEDPSEEKVRRLIARVGKDILPELFCLQRADIMGSAPPFELYRVDSVQGMAEATLYSQEALFIKDLAVDGNDLINIGYLPGKRLGWALNALLDAVLKNPDLNQRDELLQMAASWLAQNSDQNG